MGLSLNPQGISEEEAIFFHLNMVSSSMVIKVDFDLTMTVLSHNLYRLLAKKSARIHAQYINIFI